MEKEVTKKSYRITAGASKKHHSEFEFWMGSLSVNAIRGIANDIVIGANQGKYLGDIKDMYFECDLVDNVAHFRIQYQNNNGLNKINCSVDEFGGIAKGNGKVRKYEGYASDCVRGVMSKKFGTFYDDAVEKKFGISLSEDAGV